MKECGIPERTASDYMRIHKNWSTLSAKSATLPDLSYRGAIAYLRQEEKEEKARLARVAGPDEAGRHGPGSPSAAPAEDAGLCLKPCLITA